MDKIKFKKLWKVIKKSWLIILTATVACTVLGGVLGIIKSKNTSKYSYSISGNIIFVSNTEGDAKKYFECINTKSFYEYAINRCDLFNGVDLENIDKIINFKKTGGYVIIMTISCENKQKATTLYNETITSIKIFLNDNILNNVDELGQIIDETNMISVQQLGNVQILCDDKPYNLLFGLIGFFCGLLIGILIVYIFKFNKFIHSEDDIISTFNIKCDNLFEDIETLKNFVKNNDKIFLYDTLELEEFSNCIKLNDLFFKVDSIKDKELCFAICEDVDLVDSFGKVLNNLKNQELKVTFIYLKNKNVENS